MRRTEIIRTNSRWLSTILGWSPLDVKSCNPPPIFILDLHVPDHKQPVEADNQDDLNWQDVPSSSFTWVPLQTITPTLDNLDNPFLLIVDSTGMLSLPVISCSCPTADAANELFLDLELFPASYESIKTAFTFCCLDNYRSSNLECKDISISILPKIAAIDQSCLSSGHAQQV